MGTIVKALIGVEDVKFKDSGTSRQTFTRTDSNSRTLTLNKIDANDIQFRFIAKTIEDLIDGGHDVDIKPQALFLKKGADIASANALTLGTDGNYFDITGTTPITSIVTKGAGGFIVTLHFDGALVLTHDGTNIILPSANNIKTRAGDEFTFIEYDTGKWRLISSNRPTDSKLADVASAASLPVLAPGFMDVTGTNTITSIADIGIGSVIYLQFDGIVTITHNATDLILPSNANIVTAAGDIYGFTQYAAGDWVMLHRNRAVFDVLTAALNTLGFAINESEGADVESATTTDIFGGNDGNTLHVTGVITITDFTDAPRVGAWRKIIFDGILILTHGSGITLQTSANITTAAGDFAFVYADAIDAFTVLYFRADGSPLSETEGTAISDSGTPDIFNNNDGETIHLEGTTTITDFPDAPRIGMWRKVIFDGIRTLTHGSGITLPSSANITTAVGDYAFVYADTVSAFTVLYFKASGTAVVSSANDESIQGSDNGNLIRKFKVTVVRDTSGANGITCKIDTGSGLGFNTIGFMSTTISAIFVKSGSDTVGSGATEVTYSLNAGGNILTINLVEAVTNVINAIITETDNGTILDLSPSIGSGNIDINFKNGTTGANFDITSLANTDFIVFHVEIVIGGTG